ncbi:MAG: RICIN domain-containing protein [Clostridium sp.]|nr:RICIN domain-containing protein [Clostridium sp.]MCM1547308.1 RICIN domain-containing protein [Ruminococcus sp.]
MHWYSEKDFSDSMAVTTVTANEDGNVCQREIFDTCAQWWKIIAQNDGYCKIASIRYPGKVLTIDDVSTPNGSNISAANDINAETQLLKIHSEGGTDATDAVLLQKFLLGRKNEFASSYYTMPYEPPVTAESGRKGASLR